MSRLIEAMKYADAAANLNELGEQYHVITLTGRATGRNLRVFTDSELSNVRADVPYEVEYTTK